MWCDARIERHPDPTVLLPGRMETGDLRWADLVMMMGEYHAGWAVLPWAVAALEAEGSVGPFLVIDDSFAALDRLDDLVDTEGCRALARHVDEGTGLGWGAPMPGLLVLDAGSSGVVRWWANRVTDWVAGGGPDWAADSTDHAPWWSANEGVELCVDPRFRLSATTSDEVDLSTSDGLLVTDGGPLALVNLAELDPRSSWWFAPAGGTPLRSMGESPALLSLCRTWAAELVEVGWVAGQDERDLMLLPGIDVTPAMRKWYTTGVRMGAAPPNPYVVGEVGQFVSALSSVGAMDGTGVSLAADLAYESRPDVAAAFPSPRWRDRQSFSRWLWTSGIAEGDVALSTIPAPKPGAPAAPAAVVTRSVPRPFGVNLVGYLGAELGLGVAVRQMLTALESAGVPTATVSYDRTSSFQGTRSDGRSDRPYHFNLMLIVPDQLPLFAGDVGNGFFEGHHNIGIWYWESDVLKESQLPAFDLVDEVWAATAYLRDAFDSAGRVPVTVVPSPLVFDRAVSDERSRRRVGLDERFTFLFSFDFLSVVERKNPLGLFEAYCRAFEPSDGCRLVLKSINGDVFARDKERIVAAIAGRPDVELWDRMISARDRLELVAAADCYVSLHRAEGLGLTMAEAMANDTPVVATGYSGNMDFMDEDSALVVPYELIEVGPGGHYPAHGRWASPDLDAAAQMMWTIRDDEALRVRLVDAGRRALEPFSYESVGRTARDRLVELWRQSR